MEEAVEHGGHGGGVAEELAPIFDGSVGGEQGAGALVSSRSSASGRHPKPSGGIRLRKVKPSYVAGGMRRPEQAVRCPNPGGATPRDGVAIDLSWISNALIPRIKANRGLRVVAHVLLGIPACEPLHSFADCLCSYAACSPLPQAQAAAVRIRRRRTIQALQMAAQGSQRRCPRTPGASPAARALSRLHRARASLAVPSRCPRTRRARAPG